MDAKEQKGLEQWPAEPKRGDRYEIPVEGSLGLLALGARGLEAWRRRRAEVMQQAQETTKDE